jgi:hypothetical protein
LREILGLEVTARHHACELLNAGGIPLAEFAGGKRYRLVACRYAVGSH